MTPIMPEELSALLDGELSTERARQVRSHLAADPSLADEFHRLSMQHSQWQDAARSARFAPAIRLPEVKVEFGWQFGALVGVLLVLRLGSKLISPPGTTMAIEAIALIALLIVVTAKGAHQAEGGA